MEWVEATGNTIEQAKEAALDLLSVVEDDAEFVILNEPKTGLFGRIKAEARVQARVRPVMPPPKRGGRRRPEKKRDGVDRAKSNPGMAEGQVRETGGAEGNGDNAETNESSSAPRKRSRNRSRNGNGSQKSGEGKSSERKQGQREESMEESLTLEQQGEQAREFLLGLVSEFGLETEVSIDQVDDETVRVAATGNDLGLLVGPKGATLAAVQDLTRTFVQRQSESRTDRILVDVGGYREKRVAALKRFTESVCEEVRSTGEERSLEPMSPADRKVVHDTANEIEGVNTRSAGLEPSRYVVIAPGE